jgi:hypothetical protein
LAREDADDWSSNGITMCWFDIGTGAETELMSRKVDYILTMFRMSISDTQVA